MKNVVCYYNETLLIFTTPGGICYKFFILINLAPKKDRQWSIKDLQIL